jgi:hypothetical protein
LSDAYATRGKGPSSEHTILTFNPIFGSGDEFVNNKSKGI